MVVVASVMPSVVVAIKASSAVVPAATISALELVRHVKLVIAKVASVSVPTSATPKVIVSSLLTVSVKNVVLVMTPLVAVVATSLELLGTAKASLVIEAALG